MVSLKESTKKAASYLLYALLILTAVYAGTAAYSYFYPGEVGHKLYVEVIDTDSQSYLQELEATGAKKVYVFFEGHNTVPFYFLGRGEKLSREITVSGVYPFPVSVKPVVSGDIAPLVTLSDDRINLKPGESSKLKITVEIPEAARLGNYTGDLVLKARRK